METRRRFGDVVCLLIACVFLLSTESVRGEPWGRMVGASTGDVDQSHLRQPKRAEFKPMANHIWVSTNGDWSDAASWHDGVVPVNDDGAVFGNRSQVSVARGLNQAAVQLGELRVDPEYKGDIGLSGAHLILECKKLIHRGSGRIYLTGSGGVVMRLTVDSPNLVDALTLQGTSSSWELTVKRGKLICGNAMGNITRLRLVPDNGRALAEVLATAAGNTLIYAYVAGGELVNYRPISFATGYVVLAGGRFVQETGIVTNWVQFGGMGILNSDGTVSQAHVYGGTLDTTQTANDKAITLLYIGPFGDVLKSNQLTITGEYDYREDYP